MDDATSDTSAVTIRPAARVDLPAIGRLGALLVRMHHDFDAKRFIAATPQTRHGYASFLGTQLEESNVVMLVAEQNGVVIGYTYAGVEGWDYMSLRGPAGVLHDIVVDPAHRGHGVGRMLLDATLAALRTRGTRQGRVGFRRTMVEMTRELDSDVEDTLR